MIAALIDLIVIGLLFAIIETGLFYTVFHPLGYHQSISEVRTVLAQSSLHVYDETRGYLTITEAYDDTKTAAENYDLPITTYYTTNPRAIATNRLSAYYDAKITSGYFELNDQNIPEVVPTVAESNLKTFYEGEFNKALTFFKQDPVYYSGLQKTFLIIVFTSLFSVTVAAGIIYLLIPLLRRDGETPAQMMFRIALADARDNTRVKRRQIVGRFVILLFFNIWIPILIYAAFSSLILISVVVTIAMMSLSKSFSGPHDYISHSYVVSKRDIMIPASRDR